MTSINTEIQDYVERNIIPLYDRFDMAHQRDHVRIVMEQSMALAEQMDVDKEMV